jgi:hypothetical protein
MTSTTPKCLMRVSTVPLDDFIEGTGLFASLALTSTGSPVIAYYDRQAGDLRLALSDGAGGWNLHTVDGNDAMDPTDVGQHCSVAIAPDGSIAIAYYDATNDDLIYYDWKAQQREIVDNGVTPPNLRMVGADASLIFDDMGRAAIAYQDPTNIDLIYARRLGTPPMWSTEIVKGDPAPGATRGTASGFYVSQARRGSTAFIASVDVGFTTEGDLTLKLGVLPKLLQ